jgi:putative membrane protein
MTVDLLARIVGTVIHRPYVFVFFAIYVVTAVTRLGWRRTAWFTVIAYGVAFAAELSSTRNGFPFGLYHYIDVTRDRELWISNVPFWDSLSFTFLCYLGWRLGVLLYAPLVIAPRVFQVAETRAIATSWRVAIAGAVLMTWLDVVIDPLTVLGDRWFLGKIYYYPHGGLYFGVPLSNFAGWFLVGVATIRLYQMVEARGGARLDAAGVRRQRLGGLLEPLLYLGILGFNLVLTFAIGEPLLGTIGVLMFVPIVMLALSHPLNPRRRASAEDLAAHFRDYARSSVSLGADARTRVALVGGEVVAGSSRS